MANDTFLVHDLSEITFKHFRMACIACMAQDRELCGLLAIPCSDDYFLYRGNDEACVKVRNWSNMLELHIVSESGTWLVSSHIDGRGVNGVVDEAYRKYRSALPYIEQKVTKAFVDEKLAEGAVRKWSETSAEVIEEIKRYIKTNCTEER